MSAKPVYVALRASGAVVNLGSGMGNGPHSEGPYFAILDKLATELNGAGGDYDSPKQLFLDGRCVVESGLADLAWKYSRDMIAAKAAAVREVKNQHTPAWAPKGEEAPGYNPPGIDVWTVRKARP